ncbi:hypothetical protein M8R20_02275 [Pseudomonas sp. R2.Fl]|nr:hypothetical protein [Pseudomonas sp. R2.Fl]
MIVSPVSDNNPLSALPFDRALKAAGTALWSEGRSIIFIVDGQEHEFQFGSSLNEASVLALLKDAGIPVFAEDSPTIAVFVTAAACTLVLLLVLLVS